MEAHAGIMRAIAVEISKGKGPYVLKGGTALMLARGLDRFSTDLDYDTGKKLALDAVIKDGARKAGCEVLLIEKAKDSDVNQKLFVTYRTHGGEEELLKIEAKIRPVDISKTEVTADGLRIYNTATQLAQKIATAQARGGRAPRDLFDIGFLAWKFPDAAKANATALIDFGRDAGQLVAKYAVAWEQDAIIAPTSIEDAALKVSLIAERLLKAADEESRFVDMPIQAPEAGRAGRPAR
jgi:predicted nucleotidyltransferase component of viral defense system